MAKYAKNWSENGYINIIGGCCGTTPEHIKSMREATKNIKPREKIVKNNAFRLSGLEKFQI